MWDEYITKNMRKSESGFLAKKGGIRLVPSSFESKYTNSSLALPVLRIRWIFVRIQFSHKSSGSYYLYKEYRYQ
jgi:hypothetical protein